MPPKMGPSAPVTSTISGRASRGPVPVAMSGTSPRQGPQRETPSTPISPTSDTLLLRHRLTGTAVQLSWELRTGRGRRTTSTQVHFGQLEVLECLWPRDTSEPEYTEVRTKSRCARRSLQLPADVEAQPDFGLLCPVPGPQLPQQPRFPGLSSALCPPASYTDSPQGVQGNPPHPLAVSRLSASVSTSLLPASASTACARAQPERTSPSGSPRGLGPVQGILCARLPLPWLIWANPGGSPNIGRLLLNKHGHPSQAAC